MGTPSDSSAGRDPGLVIQPSAGRWEHFPHGADVGVRGIGPSREAAFEMAALALTAIVCDPSEVAGAQPVEIECTAPDEALLLVAWLNAVIYEMATRRMLFGRFNVAIDGLRLEGRAWGEAVDVARHRPAVEPKGATFTELHVGRDGSGEWRAQCVVDV
jgi:tRNA nucleotidyltransferase (CCA-adding enzyme)